MIKNDIKILALGVAALGVVALPMASYAAVQENQQMVIATVTASNSISISPDEANITNLGINDTKDSTGTNTITVQWNNVRGYNITYTGEDLAGQDDSSIKIKAATALTEGGTLGGGTTGEWGVVYNGLKPAASGSLLSDWETTKGTKTFDVSYRVKTTNTTAAQVYDGVITYELSEQPANDIS